MSSRDRAAPGQPFREGPKLAEPSHVCAVCGRVLDFHEGVGWAHTVIDQAVEDHPAVPVPAGEVAFVGRCDFCAEDYPGFVLDVEPFMTFAGHASEGAWACCAQCAELISTNQWNALSRRAIDAIARSNPELLAGVMEEQVKAMRFLHSRVRKHMRGLPKPITVPDLGQDQ